MSEKEIKKIVWLYYNYCMDNTNGNVREEYIDKACVEISSQLEPLVIKKNADGLLPCPFCGEYPKIGSLGGDKQNWAIWCECQIPCAETGLCGETKEEIIISWNKRKQ